MPENDASKSASTTQEMGAVEYEHFIQAIRRILFKQDGIENVEIQHNVKMADTYGQVHQLDVFWQFDAGGMHYRTAVECKHYKRPVTKEKVAAFASVLRSIGNINGIMVTSAGFQSGAQEMARNNGIHLEIVKSMTPEDFEGCIQEIRLTMHQIIPKNTTLELFLNAKTLAEKGIISLPSLGYGDGIYDADGKKKYFWSEINTTFPKVPGTEKTSEASVEADLDTTGWFVKVPDIGLMEVVRAAMRYETEVHSTEIITSIKDILFHQRQQVLTGEVQSFFGKPDSLSLSPPSSMSRIIPSKRPPTGK